MAKRSASASFDTVLETVIRRVHDARNFDFRHYKRATLRRRLERRILERKCPSPGDYLVLLDRDPSEFDALVASMLIKVSSFFRDEAVWDQLAKKVIPRLLADKRQGEEIRVWSAGCATGEEAFSIAILIAEALGPAFQNRDVKVFGTDADESAIAVARRAFYSREAVAELPARFREQYFLEEGSGYCIRKELRRAVVFGANNLVSDAPISRLDLLLCRNVFIYLDAQLQKRVLTRFHYALRKEGFLVLGKSELIPFAGQVFQTVDLPHRFYRKDGHRDAAVAQERAW